jgi:lipid-A-disaccharide synthase
VDIELFDLDSSKWLAVNRFRILAANVSGFFAVRIGRTSPVEFLISAGEASGEMYTAGVVRRIQEVDPTVSFAGCAGPLLRDLGVREIVDSATLAVVGLAEVVAHLPRVYRQYRKLIRYARHHRPDAAILADSPDFNLRVARHLKKLGIPVFYVVAPQVWAWRQHRVRMIRRRVDKLFCLFPFEEPWFRARGVDATYIGHPLVSSVRPRSTRDEFCRRYGLDPAKRIVALCPGSRTGEARRHLPFLLDAIERINKRFDVSPLLATPKGFGTDAAFAKFRERIRALSIQILENDTWDCLAHADVALAASGTVTIEAAVLGTPMVTYYRVSPLTWMAGRRLVTTPFFSMVNLIAGRAVVPELIQHQMTGSNIAAQCENLLADPAENARMRAGLEAVRKSLQGEGDPLQHVAEYILDRTHGGSRSQVTQI